MSTMSSSKAGALRRERGKLLEELSGLRLIIHGSFFERYSTCSRPNCSCHRGKRHGPRSYVSVFRGGKQRQHYVPKSQVEVVKKGVDQFQRMLQVVDRVTEINLELMRGGRLDE